MPKQTQIESKRAGAILTAGELRDLSERIQEAINLGEYAEAIGWLEMLSTKQIELKLIAKELCAMWLDPAKAI